ncbi:MAG: BatD family protein [Planctomycetota bacterium]
MSELHQENTKTYAYRERQGASRRFVATFTNLNQRQSRPSENAQHSNLNPTHSLARRAGICALLILFSTTAFAQDAKLAISSPPYYAGEPIRMQVIVSGFDEQPEVDFLKVLPEEITGKFTGVNTATRSVTVIGRSREVSQEFYFNYLIASDKIGTYRIGPVTAKLNGETAKTTRAEFEIKDVELADNMFVNLKLPERPVYVGERVPVAIEWGYSGQTSRVRSLTIRSPLFEEFEFIDGPQSHNGYGLPIATPDGVIDLKATDTNRTVASKTFMVRTARRMLVPTTAGIFEIGPISAKMVEGPAARSPFDLFSSSRSRSTQEKSIARGQPLELVVKPIPLESRPESFSGAIGEAFSIDIQANRTTVRVGDPITLTVSLRGTGNIDKIGLPRLAVDGGMSPDQFRLPDKETAGIYRSGEKQFNVSVRVEDEQVDQIPPIPFSYFNPKKEKFETTTSAAIPLQVMAARIVSSSDVVSSAAPMVATSNSSNSGTANTMFASGADLAIETNLSRLTRNTTSTISRLVPPVSYGAGFLAMISAFVMRKRNGRDPQLVERSRLTDEQRNRIQVARSMPPKQAAGEVAEALRKILPNADPTTKAATSKLIGELETIIYAPDGANAKLDQRLLDSASELLSKVNT